jgi:hypothetical protein
MESDVSEVEGLPLQFYGFRHGILQMDRLRRLMIAMLVGAVRCFEPKFGARQPVYASGICRRAPAWGS